MISGMPTDSVDGELVVDVPQGMKEEFLSAQRKVERYFARKQHDPASGSLRFAGNRHVLLRGNALASEFAQTIKRIYGASRQADEIFLSLMFDVAHAAGASDARQFHQAMTLEGPIERLSVGPIYFAFAGFARVVIHESSHPIAGDDFVLFYRHENSFEEESWLASQQDCAVPPCIVSAGYSSGWCSESFGVPLVSVEYECGALGDQGCEFVMAPPHKIDAHIPPHSSAQRLLHIPSFFGRQEHDEQLRRLAYQDVLTGLCNRTMFRQLAEQTLKVSQRSGIPIGLLYMDLDGFKLVNDQGGHAAGDAVLCAVADRIAGRLRESDIACRYGGDEFIVLLANPAGAGDVAAVASQLAHLIAKPIQHGGAIWHVSVSVGAAFVDQSGFELDHLLAVADTAMYEAKAAGKNQVRFARSLSD